MVIKRCMMLSGTTALTTWLVDKALMSLTAYHFIAPVSFFMKVACTSLLTDFFCARDNVACNSGLCYCDSPGVGRFATSLAS